MGACEVVYMIEVVLGLEETEPGKNLTAVYGARVEVHFKHVGMEAVHVTVSNSKSTKGLSRTIMESNWIPMADFGNRNRFMEIRNAILLNNPGFKWSLTCLNRVSLRIVKISVRPLGPLLFREWPAYS